MKKYARTLIAISAVAAMAGLAGCGEEETTPAYDVCHKALIAKYGEHGLVDVDDITENESPALVKVEGSLVYRPGNGTGDRVETWFTCQLEKDGDDLTLRELSARD